MFFAPIFDINFPLSQKISFIFHQVLILLYSEYMQIFLKMLLTLQYVGIKTEIRI